MAVNECIPHFKAGQDVTGKVTGAAVVGKRLVRWVSGGVGNQPNISTATAAADVAGVAAHDAAVGGYVHVKSTGVVPIFAGAAILAGQRVEAGAGGSVVPLAAGIPVGRAVADAANGADAAIQLNLA